MHGVLTATDGPGALHGDVAPSLRVSGALDFLKVLWVLDHRLYRASRTTYRELGVTAQQRFALSIIARFPGITPGRLTDALGVHPSTVSGIVKRLERCKLVSRQTDPKDARRWKLLLTDAGRAVAEAELRGTVEAAIDSILTQLPPGKTAVAREVLSALAQNLDAEARGRSPLAVVVRPTGT